MFSVTSVCLSVHRGDRITRDALGITVQPPSPQTWDPPVPAPSSSLLLTSDLVATTGDLFKLVHLRPPPLALPSGGC